MSILFILIPLSILIAAGFLGAFIWAVRSGQYEDTCTPSMRILIEEIGTDGAGPAEPLGPKDDFEAGQQAPWPHTPGKLKPLPGNCRVVVTPDAQLNPPT